MKPIAIIAISVVCSVVAVITVLSIIGVNLGETSISESPIIEIPILQTGEELRMASGEKICCEKYVIIHQVLLETAFMGEDMGWRYVIKNYRDDPAYNEECSRLWVQMKKTPIKQKYEPLTDDEYRELQSVFQQACHNAVFTDRVFTKP